MPKTKLSRKMYGCKLCKMLFTELRKVSPNNLRPTNLSIELHLERSHPDLTLEDIIDHISKFSKVSEARAVLEADGYMALLGPRIKAVESTTLKELSDSHINALTPPQSETHSTPSKKSQNHDSSPSKNTTPRESLEIVLKTSSPRLPTPPSSALSSPDHVQEETRSSPLPVAKCLAPVNLNKPKSKALSKTKRAQQEWMKALDRSGLPCRRWVRKPFQVRSFTKYNFDFLSWEVKGNDSEAAVDTVSGVSEGADTTIHAIQEARNVTQGEVETQSSNGQSDDAVVEDSPTNGVDIRGETTDEVDARRFESSQSTQTSPTSLSFKRKIEEFAYHQVSKKAKLVNGHES